MSGSEDSYPRMAFVMTPPPGFLSLPFSFGTSSTMNNYMYVELISFRLVLVRSQVSRKHVWANWSGEGDIFGAADGFREFVFGAFLAGPSLLIRCGAVTW